MTPRRPPMRHRSCLGSGVRPLLAVVASELTPGRRRGGRGRGVLPLSKANGT